VRTRAYDLIYKKTNPGKPRLPFHILFNFYPAPDMMRRMSGEMRRLSGEMHRPSGEMRRLSGEMRRPSGERCPVIAGKTCKTTA
jgi:hypothetical protein